MSIHCTTFTDSYALGGDFNFSHFDVGQREFAFQKDPQLYLATMEVAPDMPPACTPTPHKRAGLGTWTEEEHARFLQAVKLFPNSPWKHVAAYVGTRTVRQTMTHAQKCRQKAARHMRGLRTRQARMRIQSGHRISNESLLQDRLRVYDTCSASRQVCEPIPFTGAWCSAAPAHAMTQNHYQNVTMPTIPVVVPTTEVTTGCNSNFYTSSSKGSPVWSEYETPPHEDIFAAEIQESSPLGDLETSPSLDECATILFDLLF